MRFLRGILVAALVLGSTGTSHAAVRIVFDPGGRIGNYVDRFELLRNFGASVIIDGICAGACTLVLSYIPHDNICVTPRAAFGFKVADNPGPDGKPIPNPQATQMLYDRYPAAVKKWITRRGGMTSRMIFLRGAQLQALYRPCASDG
ncbi:hypothetical protein [Bradyrhizobium sp. USDA 4353]